MRSRRHPKAPHQLTIFHPLPLTPQWRSMPIEVRQLFHNLESGKLQYAMQTRLRELGFAEVEVIDDAVAAREVSRFARNSGEWQQLVEVCRIVGTVLIDQEMVYAPRVSNDRLLLGLKGRLNEYELDLLRQRKLTRNAARPS
jgi:DNA invertase Pin-like site-specific DNA recombinase